ncbi:hypothetical protein ACU610_12680 [Geodermatophilus sp. URMC 61]|uniref:hypothetical protein n=1 Tax=Geodermatophilus sp. URMC 61 TaxID=3423411 RepID=UPI00406D3405
MLAQFVRRRLENTGVVVRCFAELAASPQRFSYLVVDEAQDLMNIEDLAVLDQTRLLERG